MDKIIIKDSPIEGKGIFAARDIVKGELITHWNVAGSYSKEEVGKLTFDQRKRATPLGDGKFGLITEPACFMNHSCEPNIISKDQADFAAMNIKAGEEITADYTSEEPIEWFDCHCGKQNCKKRVG